jgi:bisphosphoglycerate-dependent phosphoglycerate mutase
MHLDGLNQEEVPNLELNTGIPIIYTPLSALPFVA